MYFVKKHSWIHDQMFKAALHICDRILCGMADGIGVVVAEIRITLIPAVRRIVGRARGQWIKTARGRRRHITGGPAGTSGGITDGAARGLVTVILPERIGTPSRKIYTYEWAVARMSELEHHGVADPVDYFNNEMADWWLAPNGMMEKDADFIGIARAIEERWHA
jgi:hypothetical protein